MALSMARPTKRTGSTFQQLRKRIPQEVLSKARGRTLVVPIGDREYPVTVGPKADTVTISLRTRDPREAKERQSVALAYLDSFWQSLRSGTVSLTHKQTLALAGEVYRGLVVALEDEPGSVATWEAVIRLHVSKMAGDKATVESWFGKTVDEVLARHRLYVDLQSREALLLQIGVALTQAADRLRRNAGGDYRPDDTSDRFPTFERPAEPLLTVEPASTPTQKISELVEGWWREAKAAGLSVSTYEAYERSARQFIAFLGHDDALAVMKDDVVRFKDHRIEQGASLKTVGDSDLSGLRKLFNWGLDNGKVRDNPIRGVKVIAPKKLQTRPKGFTDEEASQLLEHALNHKRGRESAQVFAAKRWVPWLCAYTGARLGEMVQLRGQDLRREAGYWVVTITPEAGTVKDKEFRQVPLHPHLVELGFPTFVEKAGDGHLFLKPSGPSETAIRGAWRTIKNRVTEFVREVIVDTRVQPNHGWRHRFMTIGRDLEISRDVRYSITGHTDREAGANYGEVSIKAKATAIAKFPRYSVRLHRPD